MARPGLKVPGPALALSLALMLIAAGCETKAPDRAKISEVESYWTGLSGFAVSDMGGDGLNKNGLFVIRGYVDNVSSSPIHHVRLRFELLDDAASVVYFEEGFNRAAEALVDARRYGGDVPYDDIEIVGIQAGGRDSFRMAFIAEDVPEFTSRRVRVVSVE